MAEVPEEFTSRATFEEEKGGVPVPAWHVPSGDVAVESIDKEAPTIPEAERCSIIIQVPLTKDNKEDRENFESEVRRQIVRPLMSANLHVRLWDSQDGESLFLQVWASLARLELEANRVGFTQPLGRRALRAKDVCRNAFLQEQGVRFHPDPDTKLEGEDLAIGGKLEGESSCLCLDATWLYCLSCGCYTPRVDPYDNVYGHYHQTSRQLYEYNRRMSSPLDPVTCIMLLYGIIEAPKDAGGAGQNLDTKYENGVSKATHFPLHDREELEAIRSRWSSGCCSWVGPVQDVRMYWGYELGFYVAFQRHFVISLILPTLIGAVLYANQLTGGGSPIDASWTPLYGVYAAIVCSVTFEQWRRQQSVLSMEWGVTDMAARDTLRPEYVEECVQARSMVTGRPEYTRDDKCLLCARRGISATIISFLMGVVIALVLSIFYVRVFLVHLEDDGTIYEGWGANTAAILTAVQIQLMALVYKAIARVLTSWEGLPTDRMYKASFIAKSAMFAFVNDQYSLFWIAFIKPMQPDIYGEVQTCKPGADGEPDCMGELQGQLAAILIVRLIIGNIQELVLPLVLPHIMACVSARCSSAEVRERKAELESRSDEKPMAEREAELPEVDVDDELLELMELFAYAFLFLPAWPLASFVALVSAVVEMWIDTKKLVRLSRRARPLGTNGIGTWLNAFEILSIIAILTNLGLVIFTSNNTGVLDAHGQASRLQVFVIVEHVLVGGVILFKYLVPDVPAFVVEHLKRQEHLVDYHVEGKDELVLVDGEVRVLDIDDDPEQSYQEWKAVREAQTAALVTDAEGEAVSIDELMKLGRSPAWEADSPLTTWTVRKYDHGPLPEGVTRSSPMASNPLASPSAAASEADKGEEESGDGADAV